MISVVAVSQACFLNPSNFFRVPVTTPRAPSRSLSGSAIWRFKFPITEANWAGSLLRSSFHLAHALAMSRIYQGVECVAQTSLVKDGPVQFVKVVDGGVVGEASGQELVEKLDGEFEELVLDVLLPAGVPVGLLGRFPDPHPDGDHGFLERVEGQ